MSSAATVQPLDAATLRQWPLPQPGADADKDARGRVLLLAGSPEIPGAAVLAAQAALRAGAGKVVIATVQSVAVPMAFAVPETRVIGLRQTPAGGIDPAAADELLEPLARADVLLVGPGMADEPGTERLVQRLRSARADVPLVLDALAMRAACSAGSAVSAGATPLLTPHAGEMAHLTGLAKETISADPIGCAIDAARRWGAVVALKGSSTVLADPAGRVWRYDGGDIGLATAGSGDVLCGLIGAFASRGVPLVQAAAWGIVVHGLAGRQLTRRHGTLGYLARELPGQVPRLLDELQAAAR